jgi:sulfur-carrier protein
VIRVVLPHHLQNLAQVGPEVRIDVLSPATIRAAIQTLERRFPSLRGLILDHTTGHRRPKVRFFACREDLSHVSLDDLLPDDVVTGREPLLVVGAISGG